MAKPGLDPTVLDKLAKKSGKSKQYIREQISRRASRLGIGSVAAQLVFAKEEGIAITRPLNKLSPEVRGEVRSASAAGPPAQSRPLPRNGAKLPARKVKPISAATIHSLLQDQQLRERCKDLLLARKHFDRVLREATTVLDDRLKNKSEITNMNPLNLVNKVLNPDPHKEVLVVSEDKGEQEGFHAICKGVMLVFRNSAHHKLSDKFTREDALKFCGLIDAILTTIEQAQLHPERA